MIKADIVMDSISPKGSRLTTFVVKFPRIILSEFNTHRVFSRNSASSRAIPFEKMLEMVLANPFIPIKFQKDHKGMQGTEYFSGDEHEICVADWLKARDSAVSASTGFKFKVTKQLRNRLLEPFMWHTAIVTSSDFENFFALRGHQDAEIHIADLAYKMLEAYNNSTPKLLDVGEWHIPFGEKMDEDRIKSIILSLDPAPESYSHLRSEIKKKIAVARCARISYSNFEGKDDYKSDIALFDRLVGGVPKHCYDEQTEILTREGFINIKHINELSKIAWIDSKSGKFIKFSEPVSLIKSDGEHTVYHYTGNDVDLKVTDGHRIYGSLIRSQKDRSGPLKMELFEANRNTRYQDKTLGQSCFKMVSKTFGSTTNDVVLPEYNQYDLGRLFGFFIGDGYIQPGARKKVHFRLKKQRKINYLKGLARTLNLEFESTGITHRVGSDEINLADIFKDLFYNEQKYKTIHRDIFTCSQELVNGLFDGLKNSDGSIKRKTWIYSTASSELKDRIIELGALFGYGFTISHTINPKNKNQDTSFILNLTTKNYILCNDSRKRKVDILKENATYYCVNINDNVLIVRRNGKIVLSGNCSPAEHVACCIDDGSYYGNFKSWKQYRKYFADENLTDPRVIQK